MRKHNKLFKLMTVVAGSGMLLGWGCAWPVIGNSLAAGFFGTIGVAAAVAPLILLGLGQFLPFISQ